jgi:acetoacetyl-CoA reductase
MPPVARPLSPHLQVYRWQIQMVMAIKPEILQTIIDGVPMKRLAKPEEIGGACVYLASELAGFMTGATMNLNGGLYYQ